MRGPTCIFGASLTPFSMQTFSDDHVASMLKATGFVDGTTVSSIRVLPRRSHDDDDDGLFMSL